MYNYFKKFPQKLEKLLELILEGKKTFFTKISQFFWLKTNNHFLGKKREKITIF
jgi:hypothetical protein